MVDNVLLLWCAKEYRDIECCNESENLVMSQHFSKVDDDVVRITNPLLQQTILSQTWKPTQARLRVKAFVEHVNTINMLAMCLLHWHYATMALFVNEDS